MLYKAIYRDSAVERYVEFYKAMNRKLTERCPFTGGPNKWTVNAVHDSSVLYQLTGLATKLLVFLLR